MKKIAVTGDKNYRNQSLVDTTVHKIKSEFGPTCKIVSGGHTAGADVYCKKACINLGMPYGEFNPAYTGYRVYSVLPESYFDGKHTMHYTHLIDRYTKMVEQVDEVYLFLSNKKKIPSDIQHLINVCKKKNKECTIL